jgi:hypothetical protein
MSRIKDENESGTANAFRFSLTGLIVFCLCLVVGTSLITGKVAGPLQVSAAGPALNIPDPDEQDKYTFTRQGPWGELLTQEISLERPVEYLNDEMKAVQGPVWRFRGMNVDQVKALFITNGLPPNEAEKALAPDRVSTQGTFTLFKPSEEFLFSLRPETRARLYAPMRGLDVNAYLDWPYYFPRDSIESVYQDARLQPDDLALFKQLVYDGRDAWRFVDFETLMGKIPTLERRVAMAASLSRQSAVLVRLCIRPDTDIDKLAAYWGKVPNVRFLDIHPMLQALKGLPKGGTVSLLYLLPPFARDRLYTYQLPPAPGEPIMDCHWSTFNFCNVKPDNRFSSPAECGRHINQDFYKIAEPGACGDVLLFEDDKGQIGHSAVYLADDLVFTKNGNNYMMPWIVMRIPDLHAMYSNLKIAYIRRKSA